MITQEYWEQRAIYRVAKSEIGGISIMNGIIPIYYKELRDILKAVEDVYEKYSDKEGLRLYELRQVLSGVDRKRFIKDVSEKLDELGLEFEDVYDESFVASLTVVTATAVVAYWGIKAIEPQSIGQQTQGYRTIISDSYALAREDLREFKGTSGVFRGIGKEVVDEMLTSRWRNKTYVDRTGKNVTLLAKDMKKILGEGLTTGLSREKMAQQVRERVDIGVYKSMRLVRTETNYFQNQAEVKSYEDEGVEFYRYSAVLDNRTTEVCEGLDGKIFRTKDAQAGENLPPMHPNCRSSTLPVPLNEVIKEGYEK